MKQGQKKYGLIVAMSMVIGIVIGSGIFFKSDDILIKSGGSVIGALMAWCVGGIAMVFGALAIANYAQRCSKANGIVDYFEYISGTKAGYVVGWMLTVLYYPAISAIIAWVAAMYTSTLFGFENPVVGRPTIIIGVVYILLINILIIVSRYLSSRFQVSATVIKLVPILLLAFGGIFYALFSGDTLSIAGSTQVLADNNLTGAITFAGISAAAIATAFAFDGWIVATGINDEIRDSKKTLPRALILGSILVFAIYIFYFMGMVLTVGVDTIITEGDNAVYIAFTQLFGSSASKILLVFIVISCLGGVLGLQMVLTKASYQLALRNTGIAPKKMIKINKKTNTPILSAIFGLALTLVMYTLHILSLKGTIKVDVSALPIIIMYICFSILYIVSMIKFKDLGFVKRFVFPTLATLGAMVIIWGGIIDPNKISLFGLEVRASTFNLFVCGIVILLGLVFYNKNTVVKLNENLEADKEENK